MCSVDLPWLVDEVGLPLLTVHGRIEGTVWNDQEGMAHGKTTTIKRQLDHFVE